MGYNLPPGVETHHLPGSRPEDIEFENAVAGLTEELKEVIDRYKSECPYLGDEAVAEVLKYLMPSKSGVIAKWQIENAVQKHIERELGWVEECARSDKDMFYTSQRSAKSRLIGVKMLVQRLIYDSGKLEGLIEEACDKIRGMAWQGPAA